MAKVIKRRKKSRTRRAGPRISARRLIGFAFALFIIWCGLMHGAGYRLGPRSAQVFAAFARPSVTPAQYSRMTPSPFPPVRKPDSFAWRRITDVLDGDTIQLDDGTTVRLNGVDAPESSVNRKLYTDLGKMNLSDAKNDLVALGKEASRAARQQALGKRCWLETERAATDDYGRALAVVHLEDGVILNEWLLAEGYARAYLTGTFRYKQRYLTLQLLAQQQGKGLWKSAEPDGAVQPSQPNQPHAAPGNVVQTQSGRTVIF